jgi:Na+/H+ antiporter NhaA
MDEQLLMITFTALSLNAMGVGAIALSAMTLLGRGNRTFAIITAGVELSMGAVMWATIDENGIGPTALGAIALVLALLPTKRFPSQSDE